MILIVLSIIACACVLIVLLGLYANSLLFFREKAAPIDPNPKNCFDEKTRPVSLTTPGNKKAVILVHGFPSSPSAYAKAGQLYFQAGYDVFIPLLPGFGTSPDEFVKTNFSQWFDYLCRFYEEKRAAYPKLFLNGTSMGGSLVLKLAERYSNTDKAPDKIVTAAAPVFLNKIRLGVMRQPGLYIIRFLIPFVKKIGAGINNGKPQGGTNGDEEWRGYNGVFPRQTYSFYMNLKLIERHLDKVTFDYTHHCLFMYDTLRERLVNETVAFFEETNK